MSTYYPELKDINYYRGTTFILVDEFFQGNMPVDLRRIGGSTFEAHIKIDSEQKNPLVVIENEHFQLNSKKYTTEYVKDGEVKTATDQDVFNIITIECPSEIMAGIKHEDNYFMDIFQYYTIAKGTSTKKIEQCLRYYNLFAKTNITNK